MCYYQVKKTTDGPRKEANLRKLAEKLEVNRKIIGDGVKRSYVLRASSDKKLKEFVSYYVSHTCDEGISDFKLSGGRKIAITDKEFKLVLISIAD
jgi:hypothetical protein